MSDSDESHARLTDQTGEAKAELNIKEVLLRKREYILAKLKETDTVISQLRTEYYRKLKDLQAQKQPSEEALHHVEALLQIEGYESEDGQDLVKGQPPTAVRTGTAFALDAAYRLLERLHRPMQYRDIASKLQEQRVYIPGNDPAATLLSGITRDARFKRTAKRGVYALTTWRVRSAKPKSSKRAKTRKRG